LAAETSEAHLIESRVFRVPRFIVARLAAEQYVRQFWWMFVGIPLGGLMLLLVSPPGPMRGIALLAVLWPITIPLRSVLVARRAHPALSEGVSLRADEETFYFVRPEGGGMKLARRAVARIRRRHGYLIFEMRRPGFIPVPEDALDPEDREKLLSAVRG
jgi:hypothetical protein